MTSDIRQETAPHGKEASLAPLVERLKSWQGERVHLRCADQRRCDAAARAVEQLQFAIADARGAALERLSERADFAQAIVCGHLNQGFRLPEARLVVVTFDEIFGTRKRQPAARPNVIRAIF